MDNVVGAGAIRGLQPREDLGQNPLEEGVWLPKPGGRWTSRPARRRQRRGINGSGGAVAPLAQRIDGTAPAVRIVVVDGEGAVTLSWQLVRALRELLYG